MSGAPKWAVGMQKFGPGFYANSQGVHIDLVELCRTLGVPPTPENQQRVQGIAEKVIEREFPSTRTDCEVHHADPR